MGSHGALYPCHGLRARIGHGYAEAGVNREGRGDTMSTGLLGFLSTAMQRDKTGGRVERRGRLGQDGGEESVCAKWHVVGASYPR